MACAKYGWTLHYVLWEISFLNLHAMLTDAITIDYDSGNDRSDSLPEKGPKSTNFAGFMATMKQLKK